MVVQWPIEVGTFFLWDVLDDFNTTRNFEWRVLLVGVYVTQTHVHTKISAWTFQVSRHGFNSTLYTANDNYRYKYGGRPQVKGVRCQCICKTATQAFFYAQRVMPSNVSTTNVGLQVWADLSSSWISCVVASNCLLSDKSLTETRHSTSKSRHLVLSVPSSSYLFSQIYFRMRSIIVFTTTAMMMASPASAWVSPPLRKWHVCHYENMMTASPSAASTSQLPGLQMTSSEDDVSTKPTTFREAEVLGLRLMQEGQFDAALKGKAMGSGISRWLPCSRIFRRGPQNNGSIPCVFMLV